MRCLNWTRMVIGITSLIRTWVCVVWLTTDSSLGWDTKLFYSLLCSFNLNSQNPILFTRPPPHYNPPHPQIQVLNQLRYYHNEVFSKTASRSHSHCSVWNQSLCFGHCGSCKSSVFMSENVWCLYRSGVVLTITRLVRSYHTAKVEPYWHVRQSLLELDACDQSRSHFAGPHAEISVLLETAAQPVSHVSPTNDNICQGIQSGILPHPKTCTKFIQCSYGHAYEFNCPDDLYFNPQTNVCDFPENVDCEEPGLLNDPSQSSLQESTEERAARARHGPLELKRAV